jgi:glutaminyl-peptide cyclotransferase
MHRIVAVFVVIGLLAACGEESGETPPRANPVVVDRPAFDGQASLEFVRTQVEFGPRVPGREGHRRQLEWMTELLSQWADTVEVQPLEYVTSAGETLALTNLLARFNTDAEHRILLLTHWDTRPWSDQSLDPAEREVPVPGANDGASGTAVLLHLAQLMAQEPPPAGVDLLFVDGEDYGPGPEDMFVGSRHFARNLPTPLPWAYGLLLDMVGDQDPRFPVEATSAEYAPRLVQRVWGVAQELGYGPYFPTRVGTRVMDDHVPLNEAGLPTIDIIDFEYGPGNRLWHTPRDTPENVSAGTLRMVGDVVTELVYRGG